MKSVTLEDGQAALLLTGTDEGLDVNMAYAGEVGLAAGLCEVIARRLIEDAAFQQVLLAQLQENIDQADQQ